MKKTLLVLALLMLPSISILFQTGYFPIHDDLQAMRQLQMDKCFNDLQIPCRWVPDMGYGFGYPLFNFYPPLPYYIGQIFRVFSIQYIDIAKVIGVIGFMSSGYAMFFLVREFWGNKGGALAAIFYVYAPYHSVDFYVRAAINEFYALIFLPLIFLYIYKTIQSPKYIPHLSISTAGLLLSHNPTLMIFAPFSILWAVYWLYLHRTVKPFLHLTLAATLSLGLAAFFTLPVIFESKYAHVETLVIGYFNYLAHFTDLKQLFLYPNWGYGASELGPTDGMSFFLGYLHWILPLTVVISLFVTSKLSKFKVLLLTFSFCLLLSLFLSHSKSTFIWQVLKPLEYLQFPWRFLTLGIFFSSFIVGSAAKLFTNYHLKLLIPIILVFCLVLNGPYFQPRTWYSNMTDQEKFSGESWRLQRTASIFDYLPIYAPLPPAVPPTADLTISGQGTFTTLAKKSNYQKYRLDITTPAIVQLQTLYFPGWKLKVNGQEVSIDPSLDPLLGRPQINLPPGPHTLEYILTNTPIRTISNTISLISLGILLVFMLRLTKTME